jgi:oligosaccharide repeat unit polymerase
VSSAPTTATSAHRGGDAPFRSLPALVLFGMVSLILTPIAWLWYDLGAPWGPGGSALIAWTLLVVHLTVGRRLHGSVDILIWIPVLFAMFYFGAPVAVDLFGAFDNYDPYGLGHPAPRLDQAFAVALLGYSAFLFGIHAAGIRPLTRPRRPAHDRDLLVPGFILLTIGTCMLAVGVVVSGFSTLRTLGYGELMDIRKFAGADFRLISVGVYFAPAGAIAMLASHRPGRLAPTILACLSLLPPMALNLALGDRGNVMIIGLSAAWVASQRIVRLPHAVVLTAFLFGMLSGPIVAEYRQYRSVSETSRASLTHLVAATFYETGSTIQVFGYTIDEIPARRHYDWGLSVVNPLWELLPNLGRLGSKGALLDITEHHPGVWVVKVANPNKFETNLGGYGYAIAAEWYFNFGIPGVLLGMIFTGWLTARVRNASADSALKLTWSGIFFGMMTLLIRNTLGAPTRMAIWSIAALAGIAFIWRLLGPRSGVARTLPAAVGSQNDLTPQLGANSRGGQN